MRIKIFTTGGSLDKHYATEHSAFLVGDPVVERVLEEGNVTVDYEIESLMRKDSLDITESDRRRIVQRVTADRLQRIIITHGTDSMVETARALSVCRDKTIVLTGAMQPAAFKTSDAAFNIGAAFMAVQTLPAGVYIAMHGRVFDPLQVTKNVTLNRFEPNAPVTRHAKELMET